MSALRDRRFEHERSRASIIVKFNSYDVSKRLLIEDPLREEYPYVNLMAAKNIDFVNLRLRQFDTTSAN